MADGKPLLTINLFANEGDDLVSMVQTDRGPVSITPTEFLKGWQGRRPPFSNGDVRVREPLQAGTYEVAGWANDEVRAIWTDPSGKRQRVLVERRGQPTHISGDPEPPEGSEQQAVTYVNVAIKPQQPRENTAPRKGIFDD